ncbi:MAG: DUF305 domain-containing protein [Acidimicrobiales bacterium]
MALAGCGSSSSDSSAGSSQTTVTVSSTGSAASDTADASFNDADVAFAQNMISHHQQAIEMASLALDPTSGASPEVTDLAQRIKAAQDPEVSMMSGWLDHWHQPMTMDSAAGHDMASMHSTEGMMSNEDMDQLMQLSGAEFDRAWLQGMIEHHRGAITMAEEIKDEGDNPDVLALADQVITAQRAEVDEMTNLLPS